MTGRGCAIRGCSRKHYAKGLCHMHYQRESWGSDLLNVPTLIADARFKSDSLCKPDLTPMQQVNICAIFAGIREMDKRRRP